MPRALTFFFTLPSIHQVQWIAESVLSDHRSIRSETKGIRLEIRSVVSYVCHSIFYWNWNSRIAY